MAGAAYYPSVAELIAAAPGEGCWWNGARSMVSSISAVADATVLCTDERFLNDSSGDQREGWMALAKRASVSRSWGDCYGYLLVASGRAEVMADGILSTWDAAPFLPIIEEAGGVFADWGGTRTIFGRSAIATNSALAQEARAVLGVARQLATSPVTTTFALGEG